MTALANAPIDSLRFAMEKLAHEARDAYAILALAKNEQKDLALAHAARAIREQQNAILEANAKDVARGREKGMGSAMLDRLTLTPARIEAMAQGLETVATLPDPVNKALDQWERPNGLVMQRVSVPLGVIGIIYESRPNVTADAAGLCIKSGNAVILRGGSDSKNSSDAIIACIHAGLREAGLPEACVQAVPTAEREAVGILLTMTGLIDVIIPRGGKSLTERVANESRVPTLLHLEGNCHVYIHARANPDMAKEILVNAKMRRTGICGAAESLLIDRAIAPILLPALADALIQKGCTLRGDKDACNIDARIMPATEDDWGTEYLDAILSVKLVDGVDEAIAHINQYGSHHTDAIITEDTATAREFLKRTDSAIVMHNTSTQFADGGEFGFGSEIGISTGRLHARGPVGAEQLTTFKYVVHGRGQVRS